MKQKLFALLLSVLMMLGLAACSTDNVESALEIADAVLDLMGDGETSTVGVIGGADGPTEILVTDGDNTVTTTVPESGQSTDSGTTSGTTTETPPVQQPTGYDEPAVEVLPIDEDGTYNSVEDVGLYLYTYGELPANYLTKDEARDLGWGGGSVEDYAGDGAAIGGDKFGNKEGNLPKVSGRQYYECDIDTVGSSKRGAKRIVYSNDGLIYYTEDHYEHFDLLYTPVCQEDHFHEDHCYENQHEHHHH